MQPLCPKDVATRLAISERSARRLMARGDIPSFRAGAKLLRTDAGEVQRYLDRQREAMRPRRLQVA
jgi:predicted site-specific integrase-resolvase